ncbi:hypothetical protein B296_00030051 [Ensete ventricosum]|uniref:Uncharacterized protein n=1 Tax=Ensete ventricosum TaxID=4639 RepID=A0A426XAD1_ENSVE|nr:hypothetical protein B296_00030051 [Ensete ventricosum]
MQRQGRRRRQHPAIGGSDDWRPELTGMTGDSVRVIYGFVGEERKMMAHGWEEKRLWKGAALIWREKQGSDHRWRGRRRICRPCAAKGLCRSRCRRQRKQLRHCRVLVKWKEETRVCVRRYRERGKERSS